MIGGVTLPVEWGIVETLQLAANSATAAAPEWLAVLSLTFAPLLALAGAALGAWLQRRSTKETLVNAVGARVDQRLGAVEMDRWRHREETMRMLRWAAELAVNGDPKLAELGVTSLGALQDSELLQPEDQAIVLAVFETVIEQSVRAYDEIIESGDNPVVVVDVGTSSDDRMKDG